MHWHPIHFHLVCACVKTIASTWQAPTSHKELSQFAALKMERGYGQPVPYVDPKWTDRWQAPIFMKQIFPLCLPTSTRHCLSSRLGSRSVRAINLGDIWGRAPNLEHEMTPKRLETAPNQSIRSSPIGVISFTCLQGPERVPHIWQITYAARHDMAVTNSCLKCPTFSGTSWRLYLQSTLQNTCFSFPGKAALTRYMSLLVVCMGLRTIAMNFKTELRGELPLLYEV